MATNLYIKNLPLKTAIEDIFGTQAWYDLKETSSVVTWRSYAIKLMNAIEISIDESIEIRDEAWIRQIKENLQRGRNQVKAVKDIDEIVSSLSATLLRQVFLQIGHLPIRKTHNLVSLKRENWRFNSYRSVLYLQTPQQVETLFWSNQQKELGFDKQMDLFREYKLSKSKIPFSKWCNQQKPKS